MELKPAEPDKGACNGARRVGNRQAEPESDEPNESEVQQSQMSGLAGKLRQEHRDQIILRMVEVS